MRRGRLLLCLTVLLFAVSGCRTLGYYGQAITGHLGLMMQREPISQVLQRDDLSPADRRALQQASRVREFAAELLELESPGSYQHYVPLERPYVVWNVFAAPTDSLDLLQWCFPVAGCVSYRGYFSEEAAQREARQLAGRGYDTYVAGVTAYSTLGWFNDPLTSPMLQRPDWALVALLFHELAHQRVYAPGDTVFNESFATFIEQSGLRRWRESGDGDPEGLAAWREARAQQTGFVNLVRHHAARLEQLYTNTDDPQALSAERDRIRQDLRSGYRRLQACWGIDAYGGWFAGPLNNAQLATVGAYNQWVPAFGLLMQRAGDDWSIFLERVEALADLEPAQRHARLDALSQEAGADRQISPVVPASQCDPPSS